MRPLQQCAWLLWLLFCGPIVQKKRIGVGIARLCLLLVMVFASGAAHACSAWPQPTLPIARLAIVTGGERIQLTVEVAGTEDQRNCGLMGRPRLLDGTGMLFDMRPAGPAFFWMKNTPETLDLIFLAADGRAVHLVRNAKPFSETSVGTNQPVAAVLELAAGEADRLGITLGSMARLPWRKR